MAYDLLGKVLAGGIFRLIRRSIDRVYREALGGRCGGKLHSNNLYY